MTDKYRVNHARALNISHLLTDSVKQRLLAVESEGKLFATSTEKSFLLKLRLIYPNDEDAPKENNRVDLALHEAVSCLYLEKHKAEGALWQVVRALDPDLAELLERDPGRAWSVTNERLGRHDPIGG